MGIEEAHQTEHEVEKSDTKHVEYTAKSDVETSSGGSDNEKVDIPVTWSNMANSFS